MKMLAKTRLGTLATCLLCIQFALSVPVRAEDDSTATQFGLTAIFDSYYALAFGDRGSRGSDTDPGAIPFRFYDSASNSITMNSAEFIVQASRNIMKFDAGIVVGPWAEAMAWGDASLKNLGHATLTVSPGQSGWTFMVGKMYSHVGLEGARALDNYNYSRSWIFDYGTPTWHTGVRIGYNPSQSPWAGSLHVYNGWNTVVDNNSAKSVGLTLFRKLGSTSATYNVIAGAEQPGNTKRIRVVQDLNLTIPIGSTASFAADVVVGSEPQTLHIDSVAHDSKWYGVETMISMLLSPSTRFSGRGEWYKDETGYTLGLSGAARLHGATVTVAHQLVNQFEARIEARYDRADRAILGSDSKSDSDQKTMTLALLGKF